MTPLTVENRRQEFDIAFHLQQKQAFSMYRAPAPIFRWHNNIIIISYAASKLIGIGIYDFFFFFWFSVDFEIIFHSIIIIMEY